MRHPQKSAQQEAENVCVKLRVQRDPETNMGIISREHQIPENINNKEGRKQ